MTREESLKILNYPETLEKEKMDPKDIMTRFEKYFESNDPKKGGSFYVQSKIYFAKEELMRDFPEFNISKFNPDPKKRPPETPEEKKAREEAEKKEQEELKQKLEEEKKKKEKRRTIKKPSDTKKTEKSSKKEETKKPESDKANEKPKDKK